MRPPGHWARRRRLRKDGQPHRPNHWHALLMETYTAAAWHWWQQCEATALGYDTEEREFALEHPRPTLKDFMVRLAGRVDGGRMSGRSGWCTAPAGARPQHAQCRATVCTCHCHHGRTKAA